MKFPLPDELTELVFTYLDIPSLLRCMQVCRLFHSIVSESVHLVYKIELFESCMEDNEHSSMDIVSRSNSLREYNRIWNAMEWTSSGSIPIANPLSGCWEFSGGIIAQVVGGSRLSLVQLPCKLKGIPERSWSVSFDFRIDDFKLDKSQDLLVLLEIGGNAPFMGDSCNIYLRTLSGDPHPRTTMTHITHTTTALRTAFLSQMQICGDRVAIVFHDPAGILRVPFLVWNWRTSEREVYIPASGLDSYAFMTEDLILAAPIGSITEPTLHVLRIAPSDGLIHSMEEIPYLCKLKFPRFQGHFEHFSIRSLPPPASAGSVPFYVSRKDTIFSISMYLNVNRTRQTRVLFVPLSTLLLQVERSHGAPRRSVSWDDWGPDGTRLVAMKPSGTWTCHAYGTKFIQALPPTDGHNMVQLYEFGTRASNKRVQSSVDASSPCQWKRLEEESKLGDQCQSVPDSEQIITRLPGRVATITLGEFGGRWDSAMIGEDHIVMIQARHVNFATRSASREFCYMAM